jgi:hypothetical protein
MLAAGVKVIDQAAVVDGRGDGPRQRPGQGQGNGTGEDAGLYLDYIHYNTQLAEAPLHALLSMTCPDG